MNNFAKYFFLVALGGLLITLAACRKGETTGNVSVVFDHTFSGNAFQVDTTTVYTLENGQELVFSRLQYYISNVALQREDGTWWEEEESYHIINARNDQPTIELKKLPEGHYTGMRYLIGVDSLRNFSGAQDGALSPSNEMFWSWNTGYIFFMVEGTCLQRPEENPFFLYHVGGFKDPFIGSHEKVHTFNENLTLRDGATSQVILEVSVDKIFQGPALTIDVLDFFRSHATNETSVMMSQNFASSFEAREIRN